MYDSSKVFSSFASLVIIRHKSPAYTELNAFVLRTPRISIKAELLMQEAAGNVTEKNPPHPARNIIGRVYVDYMEVNSKYDRGACTNRKERISPLK